MGAVGMIEDGDLALIKFDFALSGPGVGIIITYHGKRWLVTGWDAERRAFQCELYDLVGAEDS